MVHARLTSNEHNIPNFPAALREISLELVWCLGSMADKHGPGVIIVLGGFGSTSGSSFSSGNGSLSGRLNGKNYREFCFEDDQRGTQ